MFINHHKVASLSWTVRFPTYSAGTSALRVQGARGETPPPSTPSTPPSHRPATRNRWREIVCLRWGRRRRWARRGKQPPGIPAFLTRTSLTDQPLRGARRAASGRRLTSPPPRPLRRNASTAGRTRLPPTRLLCHRHRFLLHRS